MQVSQIDSLYEFEQLKTNWEQVYAADPHAHIFVSWLWLQGWFKMAPHPWFILGIKPNNETSYVAFFPLLMRAPQIYKFSPIRILHTGGWPFAFYNGFICLPEYEEKALEICAHYIQQHLNWDSLQLEYILDSRLASFLEYFPTKNFDVQQADPMPCLYIPSLPNTWDEYLQNSLGSRTRRNLRHSFREIEDYGYKLTQTQADKVERDIQIMLTLKQQRWGVTPKTRWHRDMLFHLFKNDSLWLSLLWDETTPIAARAGVVDYQKKTFYAYIIAHNPEYAKLSPGMVMVAFSLQYAIENGFQVYDFLTGYQKHKLSFGPIERFARYAIITRKGLRSTIANFGLDLGRRGLDLLKKNET